MNHDEYLRCESYQNRGKADENGFISFKLDESGLFYFAKLDDDGKVLLKSESYPTEGARNNGIQSVMKNYSIDEHYSVKKDEESGRFYMSLRAANYREIARSCSCETEAEALSLLPYLTGKKRRKSKQNEEDNYLDCSLYENKGEPEEDGIVAFYDEHTQSHLFAVVNKKGKVLLRSETYPNAASRDNGIASVRKNRDIKERYAVIQDEEDKQFYLILKAGNHKEIARSCGYESEAAAWASLNPETEAIHDDYLPCHEYQNRGEATEDGFVSFYDEKTAGYYFAVVDKEGKVIWRSEHYPNAAVRDNGIASVRKNRDIKERYATLKDEKDGHYYLILKAGNHKEIARSCPQKEEAGLAWLFPLAAAFAAPAISPINEVVPEKPEVIAPPIMQTAAPVAPPTPKEKEDDYLPCNRYDHHGLPDVDGIVQFFDVPTQSYLFVVVNPRGKVLLRSEKFSTVEARKKEMDEVRKHKKERENYEVIQNEQNKRYYVVLKNDDGDEIARSCSYEDKAAAMGFLPLAAAAILIPTIPVVEPVAETPPITQEPVSDEPDLTAPLLGAGAAIVGGAALLSGTGTPEVPSPPPPPVVEPPKVEPVAPPPPPPPKVEPVIAAAPIVAPATAVAGSSFKWWWLLPLLLLPLLWFLYKGCGNTPDANLTVPPVAVDTVKNRQTEPATPAPTPAKKDSSVGAVIPSKAGNIVLHHIFFDFDKSDILPASQTELDKLIQVLNENPKFSTMLSAYTDAKGSDAYNKALSQRRAANALKYVVAKGIDKKRIKTGTFGESNPIAKNEVDGKDTEEGRKFNRRVEITVLDETGKPTGIVQNIAVPENLKK